MSAARRVRLAGALAVAVLAACDGGREAREQAALATGGSPERGVAAIRHYGCGACHTIEAVPGANGRVGPPLTTLATRAYIGGATPNTPENLVGWIRNPKAFSPQTAMPVLGVTESDARDIAAYLYSLEL